MEALVAVESTEAADRDALDVERQQRVRKVRVTVDDGRLLLRLDTLDDRPLIVPPLVRVNAYQVLPPLPAGSRVTLVTSLKPAHGLANEAGMDGRRLLLGKGITATGNLRRVIQIEPAQTGLRERWLARAAASCSSEWP